MSILSRWYVCYLIIDEYLYPHLWDTSLWRDGFEHIDGAFQYARDKSATIDSVQYDEAKKKRKIGNIGWSKKNIDKLFCNLNPADNLFGYTYIRVPKKSIVENEDTGFDIYIETCNLNFGIKDLAKYGEFILLCVADDLVNKKEVLALFNQFIERIRSHRNTALYFKSERPWGKRPKSNLHNNIPNFSDELWHSIRSKTVLTCQDIPGDWIEYGN